MTSSRLSIYVSSSDAYTDLLPYFFGQLKKYWPGCSYPLYVGGIAQDQALPGVQILHTTAADWSTGAIECLERIDTPYILLLLEDYFLTRRVQNAKIEQVVDRMKQMELHAVRLFPYPPPDIPMPAVPSLGLQAVGRPNRIGTQAAIWRRETLLDLLRPGESIWEFEIYGNIRSNKYANVAGCWQPALHYVLGVGRGRWFRGALRSLARDGVHPDLSIRPAESAFDEIRGYVRDALAWLARRLLPLRWRQRIQQVLNPNQYRY